MKTVILIIVLGLIAVASIHAAPITNWLTDPATPVAREVRHDFWKTLAIIAPFLLIAEGLLFFIVLKFRSKPGRKAATFKDNVRLEVFWTLMPLIAVSVIAWSGYKVLNDIDVPPESDLVVEVIGHQFFWEYRYPRYGVTLVNETMIVPADKVVTLNCTSVDVIHSWWVPAFGVKQDAVPGRITHTWFKARAGKYKGQCAELCGPLHAEMLIDVHVVADVEFTEWLKSKKAHDALGEENL